MNKKLSIFAAVAVLFTAASASAQFIRVDFTGEGTYTSSPITIPGGSSYYGYASIDLNTTYGGFDLTTPYEWELTGSFTIDLTSNLGNFSDTFVLPALPLGTFAVGDMVGDALALYNFTWGAPQPVNLGPLEIYFSGDPLAASNIFIGLLEPVTGDLGGINLDNLNTLDFTFEGYLQASAVPEPSTIGFIAVAGLLGAAVLRRRFRKSE